jgi:hypothetical protein
MKFFATISFLIFSTTVFSQNKTFRGTILLTDSFSVQNGKVVFPIQSDTLIIDETGVAKINLTEPSNRVFYFLWAGWKSKLFRYETDNCDSAIVEVKIPEKIYYEEFHQKKACPICNDGKYLIPVVYGMPTKKMMRQADKLKIYLAGCIRPGYDIQFYCKKHQFDF